jgi:hypothetical protein
VQCQDGEWSHSGGRPGACSGHGGETATTANDNSSTDTSTNPPLPPSADAGSVTDFCAAHDCIPSFDEGTGSIVQCQDGEWSHSGGRPGACSGHGGETDITASDNSSTTTTSINSSPPPRTPAPSPQTTPPSDSGSFRSCDQNISANPRTSCDFSFNTFYEYWHATGGQPTPGERAVVVWSPTTQTTYPQQCGDDGNEVDCTGGEGDEVRFSQASVLAYTPAEAAAYAASGKLGP